MYASTLNGIEFRPENHGTPHKQYKIMAPRTKRASWRGLSSGIDLRWPIIARGGGEIPEKESCGIKPSTAGASGPDISWLSSIGLYYE